MNIAAKRVDAAAGRILHLIRRFDAPRERVWRAWTDPEQIRQWLAPHGFTVTHCAGELRPGGAWRCCMRAPDGRDLWLGGIYRRVWENELLEYTHAWDDAIGVPGHETLVTVRFEDADGGTRMIFTQGTFDSTANRDGHRGGWGQCFERLDVLLAARALP